ncbi:MAG: hypothetical protein VXV86_06685, partial [Verrucomicrobiota bacterium]|nr:hypothetical protein [Verrucomicrobiota bacterium]
NQRIDKSYLNYFEKISDKNIWKIISSDREYGRVYINDIHAYRSYYTKEVSQLNVGDSRKLRLPSLRLELTLFRLLL